MKKKEKFNKTAQGLQNEVRKTEIEEVLEKYADSYLGGQYMIDMDKSKDDLINDLAELSN